MPFDGTMVIPAEWSQHHQAAAGGGMNATVTVGNTQTGGQYDPDTDDTTASWSSEYDHGPARIQAVDQGKVADVAGEQVSGRTYLVQLDSRHQGADDVLAGARVHVDSAPNDTALREQVLWVIDMQMGSERFTRDLICSDSRSDAPSVTTQ